MPRSRGATPMTWQRETWELCSLIRPLNLEGVFDKLGEEK